MLILEKDDIFQVNPMHVGQPLKKLLIKHELESANFVNACVFPRPMPYKVGSHSDGQLRPELLTGEPLQTPLLTIGTEDGIVRVQAQRRGAGLHHHMPLVVQRLWLDDIYERDGGVEPDPQDEADLEQHALKGSDTCMYMVRS